MTPSTPLPEQGMNPIKSEYELTIRGYEKEENGNARVYGNACLCAKLAYKRGRFVGGDDSDKPTFAEITDKTGTDFWRHQYVIGDYEIEEIDEPAQEATKADLETIELNGKRYRLIEDGDEA